MQDPECGLDTELADRLREPGVRQHAGGPQLPPAAGTTQLIAFQERGKLVRSRESLDWVLLNLAVELARRVPSIAVR